MRRQMLCQHKIDMMIKACRDEPDGKNPNEGHE